MKIIFERRDLFQLEPNKLRTQLKVSTALIYSFLSKQRVHPHLHSRVHPLRSRSTKVNKGQLTSRFGLSQPLGEREQRLVVLRLVPLGVVPARPRASPSRLRVRRQREHCQ